MLGSDPDSLRTDQMLNAIIVPTVKSLRANRVPPLRQIEAELKTAYGIHSINNRTSAQSVIALGLAFRPVRARGHMVKRAKRADSKAETKSQPWIVEAVERYFGLKAQGTDIRTEFIAGVTTFLTMVYIVFVNPVILGKAGMDPGAVFVATCIAAAVSTFVMAFYANYPIALARRHGHQRVLRLHRGARL